MAVNYQAALAQLLKYDVGRSAYFDIWIPAPTRLTEFECGSVMDVNSRELSYLCHSAELPGESLATVSQKIYGVVEKFPIMAAYNDITLSFYTYGLGVEQVRKTFMTWISIITGRGEIIGGSSNYNVAYKDDFTCNPVITHYASDGSKLLDCTLINAFPIAISQIPLAWSAENQAISFNVTFTYTEYKYNMYTPGNVADASSLTTNFSKLINNAFNPIVSDPAALETNFTKLVNNGLSPTPSPYTQLKTTQLTTPYSG